MTVQRIFLTPETYKTLFYKANQMLLSIYNKYFIVRKEFNYKLPITLEVLSDYSAKNNNNIGFTNTYLTDFHPIAEGIQTDNANRAIIYTLTDIYFLTGIWYNYFSLLTNYTSDSHKNIGNVNNELANYIFRLAHKYMTVQNDNKKDSRDINTSINLSWLSYEENVFNSLNYINKDIDRQTYHKLVNLALTNKLGLQELYYIKD